MIRKIKINIENDNTNDKNDDERLNLLLVANLIIANALKMDKRFKYDAACAVRDVTNHGSLRK